MYMSRFEKAWSPSSSFRLGCLVSRVRVSLLRRRVLKRSAQRINTVSKGLRPIFTRKYQNGLSKGHATHPIHSSTGGRLSGLVTRGESRRYRSSSGWYRRAIDSVVLRSQDALGHVGGRLGRAGGWKVVRGGEGGVVVTTSSKGKFAWNS